MFCRKCGKPVPDDSRFCSYCGCNVWEETPNPGPAGTPNGNGYANPNGAGETPAGGANSGAYPPPPSGPNPNFGGPSTPYSGLEIGLKIFAVICAVLYLINGAGNVFNILTGTFSSLIYALESLFYDPFYLVQVLLLLLIKVLNFVVYLWMCLLLILIAFKRTKENSDSLFFGLACGGVLAALLSAIHFVIIFLMIDYTNVRILTPVAGALICVGGVFALLYVLGEAPLTTIDFNDLNGTFAKMVSAVADACRNLAGNVNNIPPSSASASSGAATAGNEGAQQPQPGPVYYGPRRMPTDRSLLVYILLSIITCGIYSYYFIYCLARDVNEVCRDDGQKTGGLLAFILLSFITCGIYAIYWYYSLGNRLAANAPRYGLVFQENGTTILLWYLVGWLMCGIGPFVAMHILIKNTNALCAAYNYANGL